MLCIETLKSNLSNQVNVEVDWTVEGEKKVGHFSEHLDPIGPDNLLTDLKNRN